MDKRFPLASLKELVHAKPYLVVAFLIVLLLGISPNFFLSPADSTNKTISIELGYGNDSGFDLDNDGSESITKAIDYSVRGTSFEGEFNSSKIGTRWEVYSLDTYQTTTICYGSLETCSFVELEPILDYWNESFYLNYGKYGATFNNTVSAQVMYVDYSLDINNPYSEIHYSEWSSLGAVFVNLANTSLVNATVNLTTNITQNLTVNLTQNLTTNITDTVMDNLTQLAAEIGKPVKWVKKSDNSIIEIPDFAYNISINKIINDKKESINNDKIKINKKTKKNEIIINETADSYEVEFQTEAPKKSEKDVNNGGSFKQVVVYSNVSIHYYNVKAYTTIPGQPIVPNLYHIINNSKIDVTDDENFNVSFLDTDNDGLYDRIDWIVPHLSEQYFEVGLATINTRKSIYHPNEEAEIIVIVLDNLGLPVKNADVTLNITSPDGSSELLNGNDITETSQGYEATYTNTAVDGNYSMYVTAVGDDVNNTMSSYFTVKQYYEFDILRQSPAIINPWNGPHNTTIKVVSLGAINTFNFTEILPGDYIINKSSGGESFIVDDTIELRWYNLNNNSIINYSVQAPLISPDLNQLSSEVVYNGGSFNEARPWYIAVDAPPADFSWEALNFSIYQSNVLTWNAGTWVCNGTLRDDNAITINCGDGQLTPGLDYRVQMIVANIGSTTATMQGAGEYVDHKNTFSGWAGTSPTLGGCGFYDLGGDDGSGVSCALSQNGNDVRMENTGIGGTARLLIAKAGETEGFMYTITPDSAAVTSSTSNLDTSIDSVVEDSSVITITIADIVPPYWSNNRTSPKSPAIYAPNKQYQFNVTWQDSASSIEDVLIEHNFTTGDGSLTNDTVTTNNGDEYYYDITGLGAKTYAWRMFANDSTDNVNQTDQYYYVIDRANSILNLTLNGTAMNVTIIQGDYIWLNGTIVDGDPIRIQTYITGLIINNNTSPISNYTLFEDFGLYNITLVYEQSQNYSHSNVTYVVNVSDGSAPNVTLFTPDNNSYTNSSRVVFSHNVSDYSSISECELFVLGFSSPPSNTSINKDITQYFTRDPLGGDGMYDWFVNCTDDKGYVGYSGTMYITIDLTYPTINYSTRVEDNNSYVNRDWIFVEVNYVETNPVNITFSLYNSTGIVNVTSLNQSLSSPFSLNFTNLNSNEMYWYNVTIFDKVNHTNFTETRVISLDSYYPTIDYEYPTPDNGTNQTSSSLTINVSHNEASPDTIIFYWNGMKNDTRSYSGVWTNFTLLNLEDGAYTYYVWLNDSVGNINQTENRTIRIDGTAPMLYLEYPDDDVWATDNNLIFKYNVTDNLIGVTNCSLIINDKINRSNTTVLEGVSQNFTINLDNSEGYDWSINCSDRLNNTNYSETRVIKIDSTYPSILNESINYTGFDVNQYICLNVTVTDTFSDVDNVNVTIKFPESGYKNYSMSNESGCGSPGGSTWTAEIKLNDQGIYNWTETYAWDKAGNMNKTYTPSYRNWSATSSAFINVTLLEPLQNIELNESTYNLNSTFLLRCNVSCRDESSSDCTDVVLFPQVDEVDITTKTTSFISNLDNSSCGTLAPLIGQYCNMTFNITVGTAVGGDDYELGCKATSSLAPLRTSNEEVNLTVNDFPVASFTYPLAGYHLAGVKILNASASSDDQNITNYIFELANNTDFNDSVVLCNTQDENCTFNTIIQDRCVDSDPDCYLRLNITDSDDLKNSTFINIIIDNTNPSASLDSPLNNTWYNTQSITFAYTGYDAYLDSCVLYHNETVWKANETNNSVDNSVQDTVAINLNEGTHLWNTWCNDSAGNFAFNETNFTINVDITYPTIDYDIGTSGNNIYHSRNWIYINVTADDGNEANLTFMLVNSTAVVNVTTLAAGNRSINFTNLNSNEEYWYNTTVRDKALNENTTKTRKITLDTSYPQIDYDTGTEDDNSYRSRNWIFVNVTTSDDNEANITFMLVNSTAVVNETILGKGNRSINFTNLNSNEEYWYNVTALDKVLKENTTTTRKITLDTTDPAVSLIQPLNATLTNNNYLQFNYTPYDENLKNCSLYGNWSGSWDINQTNTTPTSGSKNSFSFITLNEGIYIWNVECIDEAGNSAFNATNYTLDIDTTAPTEFNISYPANNTQSINRAPFINWTKPLEMHFDNYTILFDTDPDFTTPDLIFGIHGNISNNSFTIPISNQLDGNTGYYWKVIAYDNLSYSRESSEVFVYITDNRSPVIMLEGPGNNTFEQTSNSITFEYNVSDNFDVANCSLIVNDEVKGNPDTDVIRNNSEEISTALSNGYYNWSINCTDKAGNKNVSSTFNLTVDVPIPSVRFYERQGSGGQVQDIPQIANLSLLRDGNWNSMRINTKIGVGTHPFVTATIVNKSGFGPKGLLIPAGATITFNGSFYSETAVNYPKWTLDKTNGSVNNLCTLQSTTNLPTAQGYVWDTCTSLLDENVVFPADALRLKVEVVDTANKRHEHWYDGIYDSYVEIQAYRLGNLQVNLSNPLTDQTINHTSAFNVSCNVSCYDGYCLTTNVYIQRNTLTSSWENIDTDSGDNIILSGSSNPNLIAAVSETMVINFTLSANKISENNNLRCIATSRFSNINGTRTIEIIVRDKDFPSIVLNNPQNNSFDTDGNVTFYYTPGDNYNVSNCSLIINNKINQTNHTIQEDIQNNFSLNNLASVSYNWSINCTDNYDNTNFSDTRVFTVDTTYPTIEFNNGTAQNNSYRSRNWIYVNVTAYDASEANITFMLVNSTAVVNVTTLAAGNRSINFTNLNSNEEYWYNVTILDYSLFENTTETRKITLDTTDPGVSLDSPLNNTWYNTQSITFAYTGYDAYLDSCVLYHNETVWKANETNNSVDTGVQDTVAINLNEGTHLWNTWCNDSAGNFAFNETNFTVNVDITYPSIEYDIGTSDNNSYVSRNWIFVNVTADDGNEANMTFMLVNSTAVVNTTTLAAGNRSINFTNLNSNEGYWYNVTILDKALNKNTTKTRKITLDTSYPQIDYGARTEDNNSYRSRNWIFVNVSVIEDNFNNITFYLFNSTGLINETNYTSAIYNINFTNLNSNEEYWYNVTVRDKIGYTNTTLTRMITLDTTDPGVSLDSPLNNTWYNTQSITFAYTGYDAYLDSCVLYHNETVWKANETNNSADNAIQDTLAINLNEGTHLWNIWCNDSAGNFAFNETNFTVNVDITYPSIEYDIGTSDNNSYRSRNWVYVNVTVDDGNEANITFMLVNSTAVVNETILGPGNRSINFTNLNSNEEYWYNVTILDKALNENITLTRKITLDTTRPSINFSDPTPVNNSNQTSRSVIINVTHYDLYSDSILLYWNGLLNETKRYSESYSNFTLDNINDGTYTYYVWINDSAANTNQTELRTITIDNVPPNVYLEGPVSNSWRNYGSNTVLFEYNVTDTLLDVANCSLILSNKINQTNHTIEEGITQNFSVTLDSSYGYNWSVNCSDFVRNENNSETWVIKVDTTYPKITKEGINGTNFGVNSYICMNVTVTDTFSDVKGVNVTVNYPVSGLTNISLFNITGGCGNSGGSIWSASIKLQEEGLYNWTRTYSEDFAGNFNITYPSVFLNWSAFSSVFVNTTMFQPLVDLERNESTWERNDSFLMNCNVSCFSESTDNCNEVYLFAQYEDDGWKDITTETNLLINNMDNNSCGNLDRTIGQYCNATFNVTIGKTSGGEKYELRCRASSDNTPVDYSELVVNLTINDFPVASFEYPSDGAYLNGIEILNASTSTDDQNISRYIFELANNTHFNDSVILCNSEDENCTFDTNDQTRCIEEDGDCYLRINITDSDGLENSTFINIILDNTGPLKDLNLPKNFTNITSGYYELNASIGDDGIGVDFVLFYFRQNYSLEWVATCNDTDRSAPFNCTWNLSGLPDGGLYEVKVFANDSLGNVRKNDTRYNITIDRIPPIINLELPYDGAWSRENVTFYYNTSDIISDIANCSLIINDKINITNSTITELESLNFSLYDLVDGSYNWSVNCTDVLGNKNSTSTRALYIDDTNPIITLNRPKNFTNISKTTYILNATIDEGTGVGVNITTFEYRQNETESWTFACSDDDGLAPFNCTWSIGNLPDGKLYQVRVIANDSLGNLGSYDTNYNITLDRVSPKVNIVSPVNNTRNIDGNIVFIYNVSDIVSDVSNCSLIVNNKVNRTNRSITEDAMQNFSLNNMNIGTYNWGVNCTDELGNTNATLTYNLSVNPDREPPLVSLVSPPNGSTYTSESVTFRYNVTDETSTILNCSLYVNHKINASDGTIQRNVTQQFTVNSVSDGNYTWYINCTDNSTSYFNFANSSIWNLTVLKTTNILVNVSTGPEYEAGKIANITTKTTNIFGGLLKTNVSLAVVAGNTSIPWWNSSYTYRRKLNITNYGVEPIEGNYTINYTINTQLLINQSKMQGDGDDLRVIFWDNVTNTPLEIDRLLFDINTTSTNILFKTQRHINKTESELNYYFYYGNLTAENPPENKSNIYFFYDGFESDSLSGYTLNKTFDRDGEDEDSSVTYDAANDDITYDSSKSNEGKSLRRMDDFQIDNAIIEVNHYLDSKQDPGTFSLAGRINLVESYYYFRAPTAILQGQIGKYVNGQEIENRTSGTLFSSVGVNRALKLVLWGNDTVVKVGAYVDGNLYLDFNDTSGERINDDGGFGTGSYNIVTNWDNLSVRKYVLEEPLVSNVSEEKVYAGSIAETDFDGIYLYGLDTTNLDYGNYSAVALVKHPDYANSVGYTMFNIILDTSSPEASNVYTAPLNAFNNQNLTIFADIVDEESSVQNVIIEGNWSGSLVNSTVTNYVGDTYNYTINADNLSSREFIAYRFYLNDSLGNLGMSQVYNFTVANSIANISINYPSYEISRYENETFFVNVTVIAENGSVAGCTINVTNISELPLINSNMRVVGNLYNGSLSSLISWEFNATTLGNYQINVTSNCSEGDSQLSTTVPIEVVDHYTNLSEKLYGEKVLVEGYEYFHLSAETELDWWFNKSGGLINTNSSGTNKVWLKDRWTIIVNSTTIFDFTNITWDVMKTSVDSDHNFTIIQFVGRTYAPDLRINFTKKIYANSETDNVTFTLENIGSNPVSDVKLKWIITDFDIDNDGDTDELVLINSSNQQENYTMDSTTSINYNQSNFNSTVIYFKDSDSIIDGTVYWEFNMTTDGEKGALYNFSFDTGGDDFSVNLTFGLGSLAVGQIKGLDPGIGLVVPGLIQRTGTLDDMHSSEAGTTYTDVTLALTDDDVGTRDYINARAGDRVEVFNILNETEVSFFDSIFLRVLVDSLGTSPYPVFVYAYNVDNVTVDTSQKGNYTFTNADVGNWVSINITDVAHLQDDYGYIRIRLTPNASLISNNNKMYIDEIRLNVTDESPPSISLTYPVNDYNTTNTTLLFNFTVTDKVDLNLSCNLTVDGIVNITDISAINGTYVNYTITGFSRGVHYWNATCWDDLNNKNTSSTSIFTIIDGPGNLTAVIINDNTSIMLNWSDVSYATFYDIYITGDYATGFSETPSITGLTSLNWTDNSADQYTQRYYKVSTRRGSANRTSSLTLGKYDTELEWNPQKLTDWNLISVPFNLTNWILYNYTNDGYDPVVRPYDCIRGIWRYNTTPGWELTEYNGSDWIPAAGSGEFRGLEAGRSYWFEVNQTCNLTFVGQVPSMNLSIDLSADWNLAGWFSANSSTFPTYGADPYPIDIDPENKIITIDRYIASTDSWEVTVHEHDWGWWTSWLDQSFTTIDPTVGYYFDVNETTIWEHDPTR